MTGIGGPGGIGGPKGPGGPTGPDGPDAADGPDAPDAASASADAEQAHSAAAARDVGSVGNAAPTSSLDALAADIAAGKLTPQQAVDRLVDEMVGAKGLDASERAELEELMADLIANDPNLAALVGRV